ncbi:dienelactone hydrolase domain protein [Beauveria brongniartii RCEF 3172]|uniref:Dienelactone hydrolase domain protein n=1 Tax=Beauveria brongniartii RCEF 3172 TaxID=1081107 RepID=A0A167DVX4_9HYPO|nr:dienelactone hydrolase domain protein [Beauveria brongniartii RCEF 3172]
MSTPTKFTFPSFMLTISAELYAPVYGSPDRKGAAIVVSHPMTGVKEQTSAAYARALSAAGFFALTFDAGYQGESTGEPRGLEDPHQRVEDNKAAVTFLTTLKGKIDPECIGMLGICASGGYTSYAAQSDVRIKALGTVSAACVGRMTRNGGLGESKESPEAIAGALKTAANWRTSHAADTKSEAPKMFETEASAVPADTPPFFKSAAAYYGSERGNHPRSNQRVPPSSYDLMIGYDSFNLQHLISPRPLLMIVGSKAETLHYSKTAVEGAKEPKELFVIDGKNHFELYDDLEQSAPKLVEFYVAALAK